MKNKKRENIEGQIYCFIVRALFSANENAFIALAIRGKELSYLFYARRIDGATRRSRKSPDLGCLFSACSWTHLEVGELLFMMKVLLLFLLSLNRVALCILLVGTGV